MPDRILSRGLESLDVPPPEPRPDLDPNAPLEDYDG
jgi:hypothetical protein